MCDLFVARMGGVNNFTTARKLRATFCRFYVIFVQGKMAGDRKSFVWGGAGAGAV
jgi:hypothetical protein